jgi:glutaminyl-tRNA synthetase
MNTNTSPQENVQPVTEATKSNNFLRQVIDTDLLIGKYKNQRWSGSPGDAMAHAKAPLDKAAVRTRFPPEPNGYLHIGHVKSICINFSLARDYSGVCHLRFDDTNPEKEDQKFVDSIIESIHWLGFNWSENGVETAYYASNYFEFMYRAACYLITHGLAYIDEQTPDQIRIHRGDFTKPGINSQFRDRSVAENLRLFEAMRAGDYADGSMVLRAKISMAHPNLNMRDPAIYRIRHAQHHRSGTTWCIYPMYTFAHPIEDALEHITHSICTLEFEDQRPFYDWLLLQLIEGNLLTAPAPQQYEFARLNLTYVVTSKRKLTQLVQENKVSGWSDPRMPTIEGLRRRGYTPSSLITFIERTGVSKNNCWIDYSVLEGCLREDLENNAHRAMTVLNPIKLVLTNWDELFGFAHLEPCSLPSLPHVTESAPPTRHFVLGKEIWIERDDFCEIPSKGYKRLFPGNKVRLKGGYIIECTGCKKDNLGEILEVYASVIPDTKSGTPGSSTVKSSGVITWVALADALKAEVRIYDRLFLEAQPDAGGQDFLQCINPESFRIVQAFVEPSLAKAQAEDRYQFERIGYFVADRFDHKTDSLVFNLSVGLKDSWGK